MQANIPTTNAKRNTKGTNIRQNNTTTTKQSSQIRNLRYLVMLAAVLPSAKADNTCSFEYSCNFLVHFHLLNKDNTLCKKLTTESFPIKNLTDSFFDPDCFVEKDTSTINTTKAVIGKNFNDCLNNTECKNFYQYMQYPDVHAYVFSFPTSAPTLISPANICKREQSKTLGELQNATSDLNTLESDINSVKKFTCTNFLKCPNDKEELAEYKKARNQLRMLNETIEYDLRKLIKSNKTCSENLKSSGNVNKKFENEFNKFTQYFEDQINLSNINEANFETVTDFSTNLNKFIVDTIHNFTTSKAEVNTFLSLIQFYFKNNLIPEPTKPATTDQTDSEITDQTDSEIIKLIQHFNTSLLNFIHEKNKLNQTNIQNKKDLQSAEKVNMFFERQLNTFISMANQTNLTNINVTKLDIAKDRIETVKTFFKNIQIYLANTEKMLIETEKDNKKYEKDNKKYLDSLIEICKSALPLHEKVCNDSAPDLLKNITEAILQSKNVDTKEVPITASLDKYVFIALSPIVIIAMLYYIFHKKNNEEAPALADEEAPALANEEAPALANEEAPALA
ncbi:MAG: hypothetical protein CMP21_01615, partial [Rickettsiales bacterium]|nr:hypothetical protein [Rickettsiales bacterium]